MPQRICVHGRRDATLTTADPFRRPTTGDGFIPVKHVPSFKDLTCKIDGMSRHLPPSTWMCGKAHPEVEAPVSVCRPTRLATESYHVLRTPGVRMYAPLMTVTT